MKFALFIGDVYQNYSSTIVKESIEGAEKNGITLHIFSAFPSPDGKFLFATGEKSIYHVPNLSTYDAIIINSDTLVRFGAREEILEKIAKEATCPVISLRYEEDGDNFYNVLIHNEDAIYKMTRHILDVHGKKDICFVTGRMEADDAKERFAGYMKAMNESGINPGEDMIFYGDYWRERGKEIVDYFYDSRGHLPEAIVCSNDYEAFSVCEELTARSYKIPGDVIVTGFDNLEDSVLAVPALTTINVPFDKFGRMGIEYALEVINGTTTDKVRYIESNLELRESCGCIEHFEFDKNESHKALVRLREINQTGSYMAADFDNVLVETEAFGWARRYLSAQGLEKCFICLRKNTGSFIFDTEKEPYDNSPDSIQCKKDESPISLKSYFDINGNYENVDIPFEEENLLPDEFLPDVEGRGSLYFPIHSKNEVYGYFCVVLGDRIENRVPGIFSYLSMFLGSSLKRMYMSRDLFKMQDVLKLYLKDPLTDVYNRRGFEEKFLNLFEKSRNDGREIYLVSFDMDGLKYINDNFGHQRGDSALISLSEAISNSLTDEELCGRMGGDEFSAVLIANDESRVEEFEKKFNDNLKKINDSITDAYRVEASYGIRRMDVYQTLKDNIEKADSLMYMHKNSKTNKFGAERNDVPSFVKEGRV